MSFRLLERGGEFRAPQGDAVKFRERPSLPRFPQLPRISTVLVLVKSLNSAESTPLAIGPETATIPLDFKQVQEVTRFEEGIGCQLAPPYITFLANPN